MIDASEAHQTSKEFWEEQNDQFVILDTLRSIEPFIKKASNEGIFWVELKAENLPHDVFLWAEVCKGDLPEETIAIMERRKNKVYSELRSKGYKVEERDGPKVIVWHKRIVISW